MRPLSTHISMLIVLTAAVVTLPFDASGQRRPGVRERVGILEGQVTELQAAQHPRYTNQEAVDAIKAADGEGSGLDADLLDGRDSTDFMSADTDRWVDTTGDSMTGSLSVDGSVTADRFVFSQAKFRGKDIAGAEFRLTFADGQFTGPASYAATEWFSSGEGFGCSVESQLSKLIDNDFIECGPVGDEVCVQVIAPLNLIASVDLPHGAVVERLTCWIEDVNPSGADDKNFEFRLVKKELFDDEPVDMALVSGQTNQFGGIWPIEDNTIEAATINEPFDSSYFITGRWSPASCSSVLHGCDVSYTVGEVEPD